MVSNVSPEIVSNTINVSTEIIVKIELVTKNVVKLLLSHKNRG